MKIRKSRMEDVNDVTMPVKLVFGIIVAAFVIVATYRYYELPKGVTLYNDYMQFDVHGVPDSRHREKSNPKVPYACIQTMRWYGQI